MKKRILALLLSAAAVMPLCCIGNTGAAGANKAPTVIPAIREWEGGIGEFTLGDTVTINAKNAVISEAKVDIIINSFSQYLGIAVTFTDDGGDIVLVTDKSDGGLGTDGYTMEITEDTITVKAPEDIGLLYGIYTILQSVKADGYVPCGKARDYSYYQIRGGMLDVARAWVPLEFVEEITKYYSFFKLNEIHLHINDAGANAYSAFRLESDVEGLTATDGYYTKDEYRAYQKRMLEYGVTVITEIDTPAHSHCFNNVNKDYMLDGGHLDISKPEVIQFVKDLFDEYMLGDDPVFVNKVVHIGTDEYPAGYNELMRAYTDELIKHANSRGYTPRFWGSFGNQGFNGDTSVSSDAQANFWAVELSDYKTLFEMGYDIINTCGPVLYIVPGGNYGFADYYNLEALYSSWYVNYMGFDASTAVDADHEQLLGGNFALWNDLYTDYSGFSIFDIFDRLRGGVCLMSEKTWCGEQTRKIDANDFVSRYEKLSLYSPEGDPGRHNVADIDGEVPEGVRSMGWPYVASLDVTANSLDGGFTLLGGQDGELYVAADGTVGFKRGVYDFKYKYKLPVGEKTSLKLVADNKKTVLVVNDTYFYTPVNNKNSSLTRSSTFTLPLEEMGKGLDGKIESLKVVSGTEDLSTRVLNGNYALGKTATVSALEVDDGRFTPDLALDGNTATRVSFSAKADLQWMIVDLGSVRTVDRVVIQFNEHISDYNIFVSEDGETFTEVAHEQKGEDRAKQTDEVKFEPVKARYIKYQQNKRFYIADWNAYYSGGILEFEVYGFDDKPYKQLINKALDHIVAGAPNSMKTAMNALDSYLDNDEIYDTHLAALTEALEAEISAYEKTLEAESSDISDTSSSSGSSEGNAGAWIAAAVGAAAGIAVAAFFIFKKKKK